MKTKYPKLIKLTVALALVVGLAPLMAPPAAACPTFRFEYSPPSGPPGPEVTIYYVSASNDVRIDPWQEYHPAFWADSTTVGGIRVSPPRGPMKEGQFSFIVPNLPPGDQEMVLTDAFPFVHTAIFTVTAGPGNRHPCPLT